MAELELKPERERSAPVSEAEAQRGHFHWRLAGRSHIWRPPTDVYLTEETVVVRVEVAGMQNAEFAIALDGRTLMIRGTRTDVPERRAYHQMEIRMGDFMTEVELHWPVDAQHIQAGYHDGFLKIILPKATPHRIQIGEG